MDSIPFEDVGISLDKSNAQPGETVSVSMTVPPGIMVDEIFYIDSKGNKTVIEGNTFVMPNDDIIKAYYEKGGRLIHDCKKGFG